MEVLAAGPCGTSMRGSERRAPVLTWTLIMLWPHLVHYYATRPRNPYPKLGAKSGGGHGREELW